jgi:hypothetical protein
MATVRNSHFIDNLEENKIDAYNKDMTCLFIAVGSVTATGVCCDVTEFPDRNTAALLRRPQLSKT